MTVCGFISLYLILYFTLKLKLPKQYTCIITLIWKKNQRFMVKNKFSTVFEDIEGKQVKEKKNSEEANSKKRIPSNSVLMCMAFVGAR